MLTRGWSDTRLSSVVQVKKGSEMTTHQEDINKIVQHFQELKTALGTSDDTATAIVLLIQELKSWNVPNMAMFKTDLITKLGEIKNSLGAIKASM